MCTRYNVHIIVIVGYSALCKSTVMRAAKLTTLTTLNTAYFKYTKFYVRHIQENLTTVTYVCTIPDDMYYYLFAFIIKINVRLTQNIVLASIYKLYDKIMYNFIL